MPIYEYECPKGHHFEKLQKMTDKARVACPVCGKPAVRKISGGAGLVFKGSGFYITDYGKDGKGPRKPESEAASKTDSKAEAKPAGASPSAKADKAEKAAAPSRKTSE